MRGHLFERGIPCIVSDTEHFDKYLPCELIIVTEKYLMKDVEYLASMYGRHKIFYLREYAPMTEEITALVYEYFHGFTNLRKSRVTVSDGSIVFCGKTVLLTKTERRILNMFLFSDKRYTAESIAAYCLNKASPETAISHIHKINRKASVLTGINLIECKRYEGYKLVSL
ncbi:MAG: hypothetical protein PUC29_01935 [Clostridia bacterium]|nr:hypothetical protein [Clostridia bacterium]